MMGWFQWRPRCESGLLTLGCHEDNTLVLSKPQSGKVFLSVGAVYGGVVRSQNSHPLYRKDRLKINNLSVLFLLETKKVRANKIQSG
jgi:hypothetical protein